MAHVQQELENGRRTHTGHTNHGIHRAAFAQGGQNLNALFSTDPFHTSVMLDKSPPVNL